MSNDAYKDAIKISFDDFTLRTDGEGGLWITNNKTEEAMRCSVVGFEAHIELYFKDNF